MNSYKIETNCGVYGKWINFKSAHTPYDAAEKAVERMARKYKEQIESQIVTILDGTKRTWEFENTEG